MPDISTINGTDITLLSNFQGVALTSGSLINGQTASLVNPTYDEIYSVDLGSLGVSSITIDNTILTTDYKTYDIFISEVTSEMRLPASAGYVYWHNYDTAFRSYPYGPNPSDATQILIASTSYYQNASHWGYVSTRLTLYDPANPNNNSRFDAESHQVFPPNVTSYTYIKIMSGHLSSSNAATGITFTTTGTFPSGRIVVCGIA